MGINAFLSAMIGTTPGSSFTNVTYPLAVKYGYLGNWAVYACIQQIIGAFQNIHVVPMANGQEYEPDAALPAPAASLMALIENCNPNESREAHEARLLMQWFCAGLAYDHMINVGNRTVPVPTGEYAYIQTGAELWLLRPDLVEVVTDESGRVAQQYKYRPEKGKMQTLSARDVLVIRFPHPNSELAGLSPMQAAWSIIEAHTNAIVFQKTLMKNMGVPGGVLSIKGLYGRSEDDKDKLKAEIKETIDGIKNAGRTLVLESEIMDYRSLAASPKEIDWSGGQGTMVRAICAVFGVPSILIGDPERGTYANYEEARRVLYTDTAIPLKQQWLALLNRLLVPRYGMAGLKLGICTRHIDALSEDETEMVERLMLCGEVMYIDEIRAALPNPLPPLPNGTGQVLAKAAPVMQAPVEDDEPDPEPTAPRALRSQPEYLSHVDKRSMYQTREARQALVEKRDAARSKREGEFKRKIVDYWQRQGRDVIGLFNDPGQANNATAAELLAAIKADAAYVKEFTPLVTSLSIEFGEEAMRELGKIGANFNVNRPEYVQRIAEDLAQRSKLINGTTAREMQAVLQQASQEGVGAQETSLRLRELYKELPKHRADNIARTETHRASEEATKEGFRQGGAEFMEWVSARDDRVRPDHEEADGQVVKLDERFSVGGEQLQYPGDGSPEQACQCRCTAVALYSESEAI